MTTKTMMMMMMIQKRCCQSNEAKTVSLIFQWCEGSRCASIRSFPNPSPPLLPRLAPFLCNRSIATTCLYAMNIYNIYIWYYLSVAIHRCRLSKQRWRKERKLRIIENKWKKFKNRNLRKIESFWKILVDLRKNFPFLRVTFTGERNFKGERWKGRPFRVPLGRFRGDRTPQCSLATLALAKILGFAFVTVHGAAPFRSAIAAAPTTRALPASAPETYFFATPPFSWRRGCCVASTDTLPSSSLRQFFNFSRETFPFSSSKLVDRFLTRLPFVPLIFLAKGRFEHLEALAG